MRAAQVEVLAMALQAYEHEVIRHNTGCGGSSSTSGGKPPASALTGSGTNSGGTRPATAVGGSSGSMSGIKPQQLQQQQEQEDPAVLAKLARLKEPLPKAVRCKVRHATCANS